MRIWVRDCLRVLGCSSAGAVEYPDIMHVVYPVHLDGTLTGADPRRRHYPGCGRFIWRNGTVLCTPETAGSAGQWARAGLRWSVCGIDKAALRYSPRSYLPWHIASGGRLMLRRGSRRRDRAPFSLAGLS
jgi:hypothetical protein